MASHLPVLYAAVILAEAVYLGWRYTTNPPAPSDPLSVWLGWLGLGSMIVMLVYSIARRSRTLRQWARLSTWLHFHIFMGVQGVLFVFFHSLHLFTKSGPVHWLNPGVLNIVAVSIVFFSGLFGRYLYSLVPRAIGGDRMDLREVEEELRELEKPLPESVQSLWAHPSQAKNFFELVKADFATRSALRKLALLDLPKEQHDLARRRVSLERRLVAWRTADRMFRGWIILHRPLAGIMYVLSAVHIVLSYMFSPGL